MSSFETQQSIKAALKQALGNAKANPGNSEYQSKAGLLNALLDASEGYLKQSSLLTNLQALQQAIDLDAADQFLRQHCDPQLLVLVYRLEGKQSVSSAAIQTDRAAKGAFKAVHSAAVRRSP